MTGRVRWIPLAAIVAGLAGFAGCGGDAEMTDDVETPPADAAGQAAPPAQTPDQAPEQSGGDAPAAEPPDSGDDPMNLLMNPADPALNHMAPETFRVRLTTSEGEVILELHREWSPLGVDRFYNLVRGGFFDGVRFFRVVDGFVAQFGIHGDPRIQSRWRTATIRDEPVVEGNTRGRVTYAKGGPNTRSTQLFVNYADNSPLDPQGFPAIGEVVEGLDVVDRLYSGYGDAPPRGSGPEQALIQQRGNEYLNAEFPELDYIVTAEIIG